MKLIIMTALIALTAGMAEAKDNTPYGHVGPRYVASVVTRLTTDCINSRLENIQTDYAGKLLERTCFNDVLNGKWTNKTSRNLHRVKKTK